MAKAQKTEWFGLSAKSAATGITVRRERSGRRTEARTEEILQARTQAHGS
jgi:hypothetical protein